MKKLNNKGFSLVELIVVVLIMAIIAVALAPQVMKWVEESRKSTDANNYDTIVEACNTALADQATLVETKNGVVLQADDNRREWTGFESKAALKKQLEDILGKDWNKALAVKASETIAKNPTTGEWDGAHIEYKITIKGGHVYRTCDTQGVVGNS